MGTADDMTSTVQGFNITATDSAGPQAAQSKKNLSLNLQRKSLSMLDNHSQYASSYSEEEMVRAARVVPVNTKISTKWAVKNLAEWVDNRSVLIPGDPVPDNLLECHDAVTVSKYLRMFVLETRKADGTQALSDLCLVD